MEHLPAQASPCNRTGIYMIFTPSSLFVVLASSLSCLTQCSFLYYRPPTAKPFSHDPKTPMGQGP